MKLIEVLEYIDNMMPNEVDEKDIIGWLNTMESMVYQEIISSEKLRDSNIEYKKEPIPMTQNDIEKPLDLMEYGHRWVELYQYFAFAQICIIHEEYGKANNYISLFNNSMTNFVKFYFSRMETPIRDSRMKEWR